jgi:hypothetical protein
MYYNYTPDRNTDNETIYTLDATQLLTYSYLPSDDPNFIANNENLLAGLYNMKLPASIFNQIGIYTIYLVPKTVPTVIIDCSVLSSLPNINGIVLDSNQLPANLIANNALQGYRVEYINTDGTKLRNVSRYVVSSNKVVPVSENIGSTTQRATRYVFNDSGSLLFLQLTPSSASDVKPNTQPFIGTVGQTILLTNTFFTPITVEIEMVANNLQTLCNFVMGNELKDDQNGIETHYDDGNNITNQYNLFQIKDLVSDVPLYEVRQKRTNIDTSEDFNAVVGSVGG